MLHNHNYLGMIKFQEECEWALDVLAYDGGDGSLMIPNSKEIHHLQPFQVGQFWNPILIHYTKNKNNRIFCRIELLNYLFPIMDKLGIDKCILYLGHSDICVDERFLPLLNNERIIKVYGLANQIQHSKLGYIMVGLRYFTTADLNAYKQAFDNPVEKTNKYYVRFSIETNITERTRCLQYVGPNSPRTKTFTEYIENINSSLFMTVPRGNTDPKGQGIDNHQFWECMYMRTIPIVRKCLMIEHWQTMYPFVTLNDWSDFKPEMLTKTLYEDLWAKYPNIQNDLKFDYYFENYCQ